MNKEEQQYLNLVKDIIESGESRDDRTGTGTLSTFGEKMIFSLEDNTIPLITTRKLNWKSIVNELLWFISGSTDSKKLSEKGTKIWDANGSKDNLNKLGFIDREEGDLGPIYGFQWRHWGAEYIDKNKNDYYGTDQLSWCIDQIKNNSSSRRIILSSWNVSDIDKMVLPPCHILCQFYVSKRDDIGELSCQLYQRSGDMGLGVPFNIASYSLLTILIAKICNLKPGKFIHILGDAHVYKDHIEALKIQIEREPKPFPKLKFLDSIKEKEDLTEISEYDFELIDYNYHSPISMKMSL